MTELCVKISGESTQTVLRPLDFSCYGVYFNHVQMKVSFDHSFIILSQLVL